MKKTKNSHYSGIHIAAAGTFLGVLVLFILFATIKIFGLIPSGQDAATQPVLQAESPDSSLIIVNDPLQVSPALPSDKPSDAQAALATTVPLESSVDSGPSETPAVEMIQADLNSQYAILVQLETGAVYYSKAADEIAYPASLTKIMTAVVALERLTNLDEKILLTPQVFEGLYESGASMAGFQEGEEVTVRDLLYGTMLPSGADAANALAIAAAGSISDFVDLMNQKAAELGMKSTHFTNVTGLHDDNHYSTASDLALVLKYALEHNDFRTVFTAHQYTTAPTNLNEEGITLHNSMFRRIESPYFDGGEILGGKTGYTRQAGLCLASLASVNGKEYILITTQAESNSEGISYHIQDAFAAYSLLAAQTN